MVNKIEYDNKLRTARSRDGRWFDQHPQEKFNLYVDTIAHHFDKTVEWVLEQAIVKQYGEELGVSYTGEW